MAAVDEARDLIVARFAPDGFNIGINVGQAAGQTVFHLHVHLIPRFDGDVPDPRPHRFMVADFQCYRSMWVALIPRSSQRRIPTMRGNLKRCRPAYPGLNS